MDQEHFKDTLRDFCIQEGFHIIIVKADKSKYTAEGATVGCEWRIHASVLQDGTTWAIKSIRAAEHGCNGVKSYNPLANAEWVSKKLIDDIRADPTITGESIQKKLMERYGLNMKKSTLYRMRDKSLKLINGGHDTSYGLLPTYCEVVKLTNPGSYAICAWTTMDTPEKPLQFKSLFVSFSAQFKGLIAGCRSLIGVDGTHLKGNYGDVLLSAIAVDGNNEILLVVVGVVESENKERDHETWARYRFDPRVSNDENTSNFVESFNSTLGIHRNNPVLSLLEGIRRMSMVRHATRAQITDSWPDDGICPNIRQRLKVLKKQSRFCEAFASSAKAQYEVRDGRTYLPINLIDRTCKCGQWQISGIPCKHVIRAIITANKNPSDYVSHWFTVANYKVAYGLPILPITDPEQWPTLECPTLEPPTLKRSIGR
ncbi:uncharacterized protein LOC141651544 [Silene latifolia]|uniref:uncharacterized protein LOC141651544 n=1 Tax=Silene latifolia TaxID=37657 RepID=UPI003D76BC8E